jgi:hypothetical protein
MASSRLVAAGETYTPDDINNLRADVLDSVGGHKHNGTDGARVPFSNLDVTGAAGSTAPPGGSKSYNDISTHVASSQGQHGLNALAHVVGSSTVGTMILAGNSSLIGNQRGITFSPAFDTGTTPVVVATYTAYPASVGNGTEKDSLYILDISHSGCTVYTSEALAWGDKSFSWIAIGVKTA